MTLKLLVFIVCRVIARGARIEWRTHTHTQTKYCNPRCACAPRVNYCRTLDKSSFILGNELWEEHFESLLALGNLGYNYRDVECAQQPRLHSPTGDLEEIAGVNGQNSKGMCQGGKPGTGKLYTDVCLCCSAHTSGCVADGLGATAAKLLLQNIACTEGTIVNHYYPVSAEGSHGLTYL